MKKSFYKFGALCLIAAGLLTSCEEEKVVYGGSEFVMLQDASFRTINVTEASGTIEIPVLLTNPRSNDVTVQYTITSTATANTDEAVAGTHYNVVNPTLTIPAGETSAVLKIQVVDDEDFNKPRVLELTLSGTSDTGLEVGLGGDEGSFHKTITIGNDDFDCPTDFNFWLGPLSIEDVGYPSTSGNGSAGVNCDVLTVEGNLPGDSSAGNRTFLIEFTAFGSDSSAGSVIVQPTFVRNVASGGTTYEGKYEGEGTYDTSTGEIVIEYEFAAYLNGVKQGYFWNGTTIITKAN